MMKHTPYTFGITKHLNVYPIKVVFPHLECKYDCSQFQIMCQIILCMRLIFRLILLIIGTRYLNENTIEMLSEITILVDFLSKPLSLSTLLLKPMSACNIRQCISQPFRMDEYQLKLHGHLTQAIYLVSHVDSYKNMIYLYHHVPLTDNGVITF